MNLDEGITRTEKTKYPWFMMIVCLDDCRMLIDFFKHHVTFIKGVKVLLGNLEDVEELEKIEPSNTDFSASEISPF